MDCNAPEASAEAQGGFQGGLDLQPLQVHALVYVGGSVVSVDVRGGSYPHVHSDSPRNQNVNSIKLNAHVDGDVSPAFANQSLFS